MTIGIVDDNDDGVALRHGHHNICVGVGWLITVIVIGAGGGGGS